MPQDTPENRDARDRAFTANHKLANSFVLASYRAKASGKHFAASIEPPANLRWPILILRASATSSNETGIGILQLPTTRAAIETNRQ